MRPGTIAILALLQAAACSHSAQGRAVDAGTSTQTGVTTGTTTGTRTTGRRDGNPDLCRRRYSNRNTDPVQQSLHPDFGRRLPRLRAAGGRQRHLLGRRLVRGVKSTRRNFHPDFRRPIIHLRAARRRHGHLLGRLGGGHSTGRDVRPGLRERTALVDCGPMARLPAGALPAGKAIHRKGRSSNLPPAGNTHADCGPTAQRHAGAKTPLVRPLHRPAPSPSSLQVIGSRADCEPAAR